MGEDRTDDRRRWWLLVAERTVWVRSERWEGERVERAAMMVDVSSMCASVLGLRCSDEVMNNGIRGKFWPFILFFSNFSTVFLWIEIDLK